VRGWTWPDGLPGLGGSGGRVGEYGDRGREGSMQLNLCVCIAICTFALVIHDHHSLFLPYLSRRMGRGGYRVALLLVCWTSAGL